MSWYKIVLTTEQIEQQQVLLGIQDKFIKLFMQANGPSDMAMFSDNDYIDGKISIYFTPGCHPACGNIISEHGGSECEAPSVEHVSLLAGNDDAEDLLDD